MIDEPFTTPPVYEVTISHPLKNFGSVTVRSASDAFAPEIGRLAHSEKLLCTLDFLEGGTIWATIVEFERKPEYQHGHFALAYPNLVGNIKTFGTYDLYNAENPPEDPPTTMRRHYVLEDWLSRDRGYKVRVTANPGTPAIMPVSSTENNWKQTDFARFPLKWQKFAKDLMCMKRFKTVYANLAKVDKNYIDSKFKDLYAGNKFITNYHGVETADPRYESLIMCGNYVYEVTRTIATAGKMRGRVMIALYSFDVNDEPPVVTMNTLKDPRVQYAKVINKPKVPGQLGYLTRFPHLSGDDVPFPFLTSGRHWYPLEELSDENPEMV